MQDKNIPIFYPTCQEDWRNWLIQNHANNQAVWLVYYKKSSGKPTLSWSDAVDEALCFGWIDSKRVSIDHETSHQFFSKRKPKSTWSKINKDKVAIFIANGKMTKAGLDCIYIAKQNGSWTFLDAIDALEIPEELELAFLQQKGTKEKFQKLSKSKQKLLLFGLCVAKTTSTKDKRLVEIMEVLK